MDLSAAFDCVQHDILAKKLLTYRFAKEIVNLFTSYLSFRSQCVNIM